MNNIIVLATNNRNKVKEIKKLLKNSPVDIKCLSDYGPLPEVIEDKDTFEENAYKKAYHYARVLGLPCLADDSGLVTLINATNYSRKCKARKTARQSLNACCPLRPPVDLPLPGKEAVKG